MLLELTAVSVVSIDGMSRSRDHLSYGLPSTRNWDGNFLISLVFNCRGARKNVVGLWNVESIGVF